MFFFAIGTSGLVYPAARLISFAQRCGAMVVVVNPDEEAQALLSYYKLQGPSGQVLPELLQVVWPGA